jgi:fructose-bisphosphate aldolase class I
LSDAESNLPGQLFEATKRRPLLIPENQERLETKMTNADQQMQKMKSQPGFVAALDQSGGSTPHALELYGIGKDRFSNEEQMYDLVHQMRTRLITSPSFTGDRILAAILFENTMDRDIEKQPTADYLWNVKRVVPILKVDKGLEPEQNGVQVMKSHPQLAALLDKARSKRIFGTKMRSFIKQANPAGIDNIVRQQFEWAGRIIDAGLIPIIEPEVDIHCPQKAKAEELLKAGLLARLGDLPANQRVMLKLTLPDKADFYADCVSHPKVVRVLALSGGYTQKEADDLLRKNHGVIASFSRALLEGLTDQQADAQFNATLDASIKAIYEASIT